ncbi:MAG: TrkA family potassium uptake protein [Spirochaetia bacterium]|nr:TrkA family potassium uptake protein [Spirochaetia bacterium]
MKQFLVIGLGYFGRNVLDELLELGAEVLVIDRDRELLDRYQGRRISAYAIESLSEASLRRILPGPVDGVVIDMGERVESSILATSYCRKLGIAQIVVKAEDGEHAEILELVGATRIVFPNREAAKRVTPLMLSSALLNYLPVSGKLAIAEIAVPDSFVGRNVLEVGLRKNHGLNLISVKNGDEDYGPFVPEYAFRTGDVALVSGTDAQLEAFAASAGRGNGRAGRRARAELRFGKLFGLGRR